jgi:hypothetical protein
MEASLPPFLEDPFSAESLSDADIEEGEAAGTGRVGGRGQGGEKVGENTGSLTGDGDREKRPIVSAKETCNRSSESVTEDNDVLTQTYALG